MDHAGGYAPIPCGRADNTTTGQVTRKTFVSNLNSSHQAIQPQGRNKLIYSIFYRHLPIVRSIF